MSALPDFLSSGENARLIPIVADTSRERRIASVFLSALVSVEEFGREMLRSVGMRIGPRTRMHCYTETEFHDVGQGKKPRPDGLIRVSKGKQTWTALLEAKIGRSELNKEQILEYLQLARNNHIDAVVTISNQFATLPTHHPVKFTKAETRGVELYHWSWSYVLTQASLLLQDDGIASPDQRYLLTEVVRYFEHDASGVVHFDQMNRGWKDVVTTVQSGGPLRRTSDDVTETVASWHQELRDLALGLSSALGRFVTIKLLRSHASDPRKRLLDDCANLVETKQLTACLDIPDAAAPIDLVADLQRRSIICSMRLMAPQDKKRPLARINWVKRQLSHCQDGGVLIAAIWPGRSPDTLATLADVQADSSCLLSLNPNLVPQHFEVRMIRDLAGRFSGSRTFIEQLETFVPEFYKNVGQQLRAWVPPPPKIEIPTKEPDKPRIASERKNAVASSGVPREEPQSGNVD